MFITELLQVWPVGHMDHNITDWATKLIQVSWNGNLPIRMWHLSLQNHSYYSLLCVKKWQKDEEKYLKNLQKKEGYFETT